VTNTTRGALSVSRQRGGQHVLPLRCSRVSARTKVCRCLESRDGSYSANRAVESAAKARLARPHTASKTERRARRDSRERPARISDAPRQGAAFERLQRQGCRVVCAGEDGAVRSGPRVQGRNRGMRKPGARRTVRRPRDHGTLEAGFDGRARNGLTGRRDVQRIQAGKTVNCRHSALSTEDCL